MKVAILGNIHQDGLDYLKSHNISITEINDFDDQNSLSKISDVDGIVIRTMHLGEEILSKCKKLKIVARHGVGYDNVDLDYLNKKI